MLIITPRAKTQDQYCTLSTLPTREGNFQPNVTLRMLFNKTKKSQIRSVIFILPILAKRLFFL